MNLITEQQHSRVMPDIVRRHIEAREPVVVHTNWGGHAPDARGNLVPVPIDPSRDAGEMWTDNYGVVEGSHSKLHRRNGSRPCVHAIKVPAPTELFSISWVRQLGWQPALYTIGSCPVIACRVEDLVTLAFDVVGPVLYCHRRPGPLVDANRWTYRMHPFIFDDRPDEVYPTCWLGVWPD
jgi:hypothetical protein